MKSVKHEIKEKVIHQCHSVCGTTPSLHDKLISEIETEHPRRVIGQVLHQICKQTNSHYIVADDFNDAGYTDSLLKVMLKKTGLFSAYKKTN